MMTIAPEISPTLPGLPRQVRYSRGLPLGHEPDIEQSDIQSEANPTAMTIAIVGESKSRVAASVVASYLAGLAVTDELVVVFGAGADDSGVGVLPLVEELRDLLPRHTICALYLAPRHGFLGSDVVLLDELLEVGRVPIVVTPAEAARAMAADLANHLRADRVLSVSYTLTSAAYPQPVFRAGSAYPAYAR